MNKRMFKRILAGLLAFILVLNSCPELLVKAEESYEIVYAYDLAEMKQRLLSAPENEQVNAVTFPVTAVNMNIGEEVIFHVIRQGSVEEEQTVSMLTYDMSAGYGDDYEIMVDGEVIDGKANKLYDGKNTTYDVYFEGYEPEGEQETESEEAEVYTEEMIESAEEDASSSRFEVTFAEGEDIKEIRIRASRPRKTTVDKQFCLMIADNQTQMGSTAISSVVFSINETRETEESKITIDKKSIKVQDGYVTVLVERKGNTEGYETYDVSAEDGTAVNGEDYILKSGQLMFSPGVSRQRIHIPLVTSDETETKSFTVKAADDEAVVTYETARTSTSVFKESREYINVPWNEFVVAGNKLGAYEFYRQNDNERYILASNSGIGDGDCRTLSIRSGSKYNFTGIKGIRFSASYAIGTVAGDFLNVYASNEDFYDSTSKLDSIDDKKYGQSYGVLDLDGQALLTAPVDRSGEYYVYVTMQQHNVLGGHIEYNLYDQEFDGGKKGHLALIKEDYTLEILGPDSLGTTVPAGDISLTMNSDPSVSGDRVKAYRDESFTLNYELLDEGAYYAGYEILDFNDKIIYSKETTDPVFVLSSDIIELCKGRLSDDTLSIRPVFKRKKAEMAVEAQKFEKLEMEGLYVNMDEENGKAVFYDKSEVISTVTWDVGEYESGSTISFKATDNPDYNGDYRFTAYKVVEGNEETLQGLNPLYYMGKEMEFIVDHAYYRITPLVSNMRAPFYLEVKGADHGTFTGKPEGYSQNTYTMKEYDGKYEPTDIAVFRATPDEGYRAKWSYRDVASGAIKTYYGNAFYYRVQFPTLTTDNYVTLEFEENSKQEEYTVVTDVYMQAGDVLHASANQDLYHPVEKCSVSMGMVSGKTDGAGRTTLSGTKNVVAAKDEIHTAILFVNNRYYIEEVDFSKAENNTVCQEIKLPYYTAGPYVTSIRYVDYDGVSQNGDTIYLEGETDGCIIAAKVENKNKEITDVIFKLKDKNGVQKGEGYKAERIGDEYCWSSLLGNLAEEGDQIWIELINAKYNEDGTIAEYESYGEVNTGYEIVIAEFSEVSYIPDIGPEEYREDNLRSIVAGDIWSRIFKGFGFLFSAKGMAPQFSTSKVGDVIYIDLGIVASTEVTMKKGEKFHITHINDWKEYMKSAIAYMGKRTSATDREQARQVIKSRSFSIHVPISGRVALYEEENKDTMKTKLLWAGAGIYVGVDANFTFTWPGYAFGFLPWYVTLDINPEFTDSFMLVPNTMEGYVPIEHASDPWFVNMGHSNTFVPSFEVTGWLGAGVSGVFSIAGGVTGHIGFEFIGTTVGKGVGSINGNIRVELFLVSKTFSGGGEGEIVLFDTTKEETVQASRMDEQTGQNLELLNEKIDELMVKLPENYQQTVNMNNGEGILVEDAYEFSRPKIHAMDNNKYMIITTVDSKYVNGFEEEGRAVLSMAIYDGDTDEYVSSGDGKIFMSIEPKDARDKSINFNPSVTELSDGKYLIAWNSVLYDKEELILRNIRSVIKTAILDINDIETTTYKSLVIEDENGENLHTGIVENVVYDENNEKVILLYRATNFGNLDGDSTYLDFAKLGTKLCVASIKTDESSLKNSETTWENSIVLTESGDEKVIKSTDIAVMNDVPVITYHVLEGEDVSVFNEGGAETDHIHITSLKCTGQGYEKDFDEELKLDATQYHADTKLASGIVDGKEVNLIMWKQNNRIATANVSDILDGSLYNGNADASGLAVIEHESTEKMENIRVFTGENGSIYSMWTESVNDGTEMKMSVLDKHGDSVSWGKGSTVFETDSQNYIMNYSASVGEDGKLVAIYRQTDLSNENGYSAIGLQNTDLAGGIKVVDYVEAENKTMDFTMFDNSELHVSNLYPAVGETITVTARVRNDGVNVVREKSLTLNVDGQSTGITQEIPDLASGEEAYIEFEYTVPEEVSKRGAVFSVGSSEQEVYSDEALEVSGVQMKELNVAQEGEDSNYSVTVQVKNAGNNVSKNITAVVSYLTTTSDETGAEFTSEEVLGYGNISAVRPNTVMSTTFDVTILEEMFMESEAYRLAPIAITLYENYGTEDQFLITSIDDYVEATMVPEAEKIVVEKTMTIGVGQKDNIYVAVTPLEAQMYAELQYQISDESVASVDKNGIVTGLKEGTCEVYVKAENGIEAILQLTVQKEAVEDDDTTSPDISDGDGPIKDDSGKFDPDGESDKRDDESNTGNTEGTATDDQTRTELWIVLLMISAGVMGIVWYQRRKFR